MPGLLEIARAAVSARSLVDGVSRSLTARDAQVLFPAPASSEAGHNRPSKTLSRPRPEQSTAQPVAQLCGAGSIEPATLHFPLKSSRSAAAQQLPSIQSLVPPTVHGEPSA